MKIVLTAGGTREPIDDVRFVSNVATGALPAAMANALLTLGHEVHYIHGPGALLPGHATLDLDLTREVDLRAQTSAWLTEALQRQEAMRNGQLMLHPVHTAAEVAERLFELCQKLQPEAVACAMAVADFAPVPTAGKLSSNQATLTLQMAATAKAIDGVKKAAPTTHLLGFKLLSGATEAQLCAAAGKQIQRSGADLVFCNDMQDLRQGRRRGLLVGPGPQVRARIDGGQGHAGLRALAQGIVNAWLSPPS
jgi:phosphopantothenoylcysteine synthetase/decarboxylase